jgi:lipopolysaccharide/colanic/teichoic acid biosynthesis glycosyltransferase
MMAANSGVPFISRLIATVTAEQVLKRAFDLCIALVLGFLILPVVFLVVAAIKIIDPGPGFFMQSRRGLNGKSFRLLKLRTMRTNGDAWLRQYLAENPGAKDPRIHRSLNDPRILPILGRPLRRYSVDELPQIWNVIRGDISLVGPRALPDYHCELLSPEFLSLRSQVRPGITGLWQIESRADAGPESIELYDRQYLDHWTFGKDLRILALTVICVLSGSGL